MKLKELDIVVGSGTVYRVRTITPIPCICEFLEYGIHRYRSYDTIVSDIEEDRKRVIRRHILTIFKFNILFDDSENKTHINRDVFTYTSRKGKYSLIRGLP